MISDQQFNVISSIAHDKAGLVLVKSKAPMISARLEKRVRALEMQSLEEYVQLLQSGHSHNEMPELISALTTNVSHFFREQHHFEILKDEVIPFMSEGLTRNEKLRIWSAGCSNGQELYSIAMCIEDTKSDFFSSGLKLLGTDIDKKVVSKAKSATYSDSQIQGIPAGHQSRFLSKSDKDGDYRVNLPHMDSITFRVLNLLEEWPMKLQFDAVFCRNVVIYFDEETQAQLWTRFERAIKPGGWLFLGHSERIQNLSSTNFESVGVTAYRKNRAGS